ncbi:MAG: hypothetical protein ACQETD_01515 [Pseudomonadota bacterium]
MVFELPGIQGGFDADQVLRLESANWAPELGSESVSLGMRLLGRDGAEAVSGEAVVVFPKPEVVGQCKPVTIPMLRDIVDIPLIDIHPMPPLIKPVHGIWGIGLLDGSPVYLFDLRKICAAE